MVRRIALLVGNGRFSQQSELPNLSVARTDVLLFDLLLRENAGFDETHLLINEPNRVIDREIEWLTNKRGVSDTILFYYTGHGVHHPDERHALYLAMKNTVKKDGMLDRSSALSGQVVRQLLWSSAAGRKIVILDCCFAERFMNLGKGEALEVGTELPVAPVIYPIQSRERDSIGYAVFMASGKYELARQGHEIEASQRPDDPLFTQVSAFTYFLLQGLMKRSASKPQTLLNWYTDAAASVIQVTTKPNMQSAEQTPVQSVSLNDFPWVIAQKRRELSNNVQYALEYFEDTDSHFSALLWGDYRIGSAPQNDKDARSDEFGQTTPIAVLPFHIACFPVTNRLYQAFVESGGYDEDEFWAPQCTVDASVRVLPSDYRYETADLPRVNITWCEAVAFTRWASRLTGKTIRLPSELEWEFAARAGDEQAIYPWGISWKDSQCNWRGEPHRKPTLLGIYAPNNWGLFDMAGNVWEWCSTRFHPRFGYPYERDERDVFDELVTYLSEATPRVLRGGSFKSAKTDVRCAARARHLINYRSDDIGFRVVIQVDQTNKRRG